MKSISFPPNSATRTVPISRLNLGSLGEVLDSAGFKYLGDLLRPDSDPADGLDWICGLDPDDAKELSSRLRLLQSLIDRQGDVAWDAYHANCVDLEIASATSEASTLTGATDHKDFTPVDVIVPSRDVTNGSDFVRAFPEVIDAIVYARNHAVDRAILLDRLSRQPDERMTLDQIASSAPIRVTRERVRQRETKILKLLANALIHGRQRALGLKFRDTFTAYWRVAAKQFGEETEITFAKFIAGLESAWNVPAEELFAHLPLITSVLTSKATIPEKLRMQMKRDPRLYQGLSATDREMSIKRLALGKVANSLIANGIETVGDLFDAARSGRTPEARSGAGRVVERVLAALLGGMGADGKIDWLDYEARMSLVRLPAADPSSIVAFLASITESLEAIIHADHYSERAVEIFRLRIAVTRVHRLTLAQTAERLRSHGPSIKREESVMLSRLNDHLVDRDMTRSTVSLSKRYLSYWSEAAEIYGQYGDSFEDFKSVAMKRWGVSRSELEGSGEVLWAVLSQYPAGRPRRSRNMPQVVLTKPVDNVAPLGLVVLRGFKRVH